MILLHLIVRVSSNRTNSTILFKIRSVEKLTHLIMTFNNDDINTFLSNSLIICIYFIFFYIVLDHFKILSFKIFI